MIYERDDDAMTLWPYESGLVRLIYTCRELEKMRGIRIGSGGVDGSSLHRITHLIDLSLIT